MHFTKPVFFLFSTTCLSTIDVAAKSCKYLKYQRIGKCPNEGCVNINEACLQSDAAADEASCEVFNDVANGGVCGEDAVLQDVQGKNYFPKCVEGSECNDVSTNGQAVPTCRTVVTEGPERLEGCPAGGCVESNEACLDSDTDDLKAGEEAVNEAFCKVINDAGLDDECTIIDVGDDPLMDLQDQPYVPRCALFHDCVQDKEYYATGTDTAAIAENVGTCQRLEFACPLVGCGEGSACIDGLVTIGNSEGFSCAPSNVLAQDDVCDGEVLEDEQGNKYTPTCGEGLECYEVTIGQAVPRCGPVLTVDATDADATNEGGEGTA